MENKIRKLVRKHQNILPISFMFLEVQEINKNVTKSVVCSSRQTNFALLEFYEKEIVLTNEK